MMLIDNLAKELWQRTRQNPVDQLIKIDGEKVKVHLEKHICDCGCHIRFTFWASGPWPLVRRLRKIFLPNGIAYPGENGELIRFIQEFYKRER
jgi:hypothetical protein